MKEEGPNEIAGDSDAGITHGSDNRREYPLPQDSQSLANERSGPGATVENKAEESLHVRKTSGPRTPEGKQRSKHNALKHGIFSKIVLLSGESTLKFTSVLNGLRNDLRPEGALEEILVEKLASVLWRSRRVLIAEGAEIQRGTLFCLVDKTERDRQEAAIFLRSEGKSRAGLFSRIENPLIHNRCMDLLRDLKESIPACKHGRRLMSYSWRWSAV